MATKNKEEIMPTVAFFDLFKLKELLYNKGIFNNQFYTSLYIPKEEFESKPFIKKLLTVDYCFDGWYAISIDAKDKLSKKYLKDKPPLLNLIYKAEISKDEAEQFNKPVLAFSEFELREKLEGVKYYTMKYPGNEDKAKVFRVNSSGLYSIICADDYAPAEHSLLLEALNKPENVCKVCELDGSSEGSGIICNGWKKGHSECSTQMLKRKLAEVL